MKPQKFFFGSNLRFLRERKKLSQEALAERLQLSRSKLNALENGHTKAPQPEDYLRISEFFSLSIDCLLKVDLSRLSELSLRELEHEQYLNGSQLRVLAITVDSGNRENLEYVPVKAKAGYRTGYADPDYLATLPKFSLPNLPEGHTYRMFSLSGDSMLPIPEGSDVITRFVANWKMLKPDTPCVVILRGEQDFVFKQVTVRTDGSLLLRSYNALYEPYAVEAAEVLEIWEYHSFQSRQLPESETRLEQLLKLMQLVQREVRELKQRG